MRVKANMMVPLSVILLVPRLLGDQASSRCSPWPLRASLVSSSSTSLFRRALTSPRATLSISPVMPLSEQVQSQSSQIFIAPGSPQRQDPDSSSTALDAQEVDPLDMQEVSFILE